MFSTLFKKKKNKQKQINTIAKGLYACALENTRQEIFYTQYQVADNIDGRFDLLLLHIFLILHPIMEQENYAEISQALFDITFKDMDQTLREVGVGDVGIPKHMKRMMLAFNGRMHVYKDAIGNSPDLVKALARNIYGIDDLSVYENKNIAKNMCDFVYINLKQNGAAKVNNLLNGRACFINEVSEESISNRSNNVA